MPVYVLPYPPSVNRYWRTVSIRGARRTLISAAGRSYRAEVVKTTGGDEAMLVKPLKVVIEATMPDKRARDLDNIPKAILDSLTHAGIWQDDSQIDDLRIIRCGVAKPGKVVVRIEELT